MSGSLKSSGPDDRNCLSRWFPILERSGVPVPRTEVVATAPDLAGMDLLELMNGKNPPGFEAFVERLRAAGDRVAGPSGWPVFLRTGHTSGKHEWKRYCLLADRRAVAAHVGGLVEFSMAVDFFGLPLDQWAVREFVPVDPIAILTRYGGLPLNNEIRAFVSGGRVACIHPYWPADAVYGGLSEKMSISDREATAVAAQMIHIEDVPTVAAIVQRVADAFKDLGAWSVDLLLSAKGEWLAIDMATAERSYHDPKCPFAAAGAFDRAAEQATEEAKR